MRCRGEPLNRQPLALVVDGERTIEMFADHDPGFRISAALGVGEDLEHVLPQPGGVVVGDDALVGEAADVVEGLRGRQRPIGGARIGRGLREARVVAGQERHKDGVIPNVRQSCQFLLAKEDTK